MSQDSRIAEIQKLLLLYAAGNFKAYIEPSSGNDALDAVIVGLNMLGEELRESLDREQRMQDIQEMLIHLAQGHLEARITPSDRGDDVDALMEGLNMLAEELSSATFVKAQLRQLVNHDELTGLPNRRLLQDRLRVAMARAKRTGQKVGIMFLDLNKFKEANDRYGHEVGDQILIHVAHACQKTIRESDTVARTGGDEFVVLLEDLKERADAEIIQVKMAEAIKRPLPGSAPEITISASMGLACYPEDGTDTDTLMRLADASMYSQKGGPVDLETRTDG